MGTKVGRIVKDFVLSRMMSAGIPFELRFHKNRVSCRIVGLSDATIDLEVLEGPVGKLRRGDAVQVFLHFQNNHHAFDSTCVAVPEKPSASPPTDKTAFWKPPSEPAQVQVPRISIAHPRNLAKDLQRKHVRQRLPEGMEIYFVVQGQRVDLGFPRAKRPGPPPVPGQATVARLDALIKEFRAEATGLFSTNRLVMFRDRQPSGYEENLVAALGAVLWLPTIEEGLPEKEPIPGVPIVTRDDLRAHEIANGAAEELVDGRIAKLLVTKRARGVHAEATCPVLYGEYVLGCVAIANVEPRRERITEEHVQHVWQFSRVLSSALERNRYVAEGAAEKKRYDAPVIDLSASGLLFRHSSADLSTDLVVNSDLPISLVVEGRTIQVKARIRRKFTEPGEVYYGAQFVEIAREDYTFLFQFLYGRRPTEQDEELWEGGSPPPPVNLFDGKG
jgi:GAF domain-containing protein